MTRSVRLLFLVIFAVSMFTAHAEKFVAQETLPADYDRLQDWYSSVVRIEITKGAAAGTNAAPPEVEYKIIEVVRKGRFPPRQREHVCMWRDDSTITSWHSHSLADPPDPEWEAEKSHWEEKKVIGPPAGTKLIVFTGYESSCSPLYKGFAFADTPGNLATALENAAYRPFLDRLRLTEMAFWLTLTFPLAGFICLFYSPKLASFIAMLAWPSYLFYDSMVSVTSIRLDVLFTYPALGIASLIAAVGFVLWVRAVGRTG
ncbi:MAG: hypothetical protein Q8N48_11045 [Thiobacillus sp.]|nr:hypothetical protein [Thiobacillus sp.]MDP2979348.1 hypothetical protein [Thiobacillus sp.]